MANELKFESIAYQREQYDEKNAVLEQFGDRVSPVTFYEDIFLDTSLLMPVVIIDEAEEKHIVKMTVDEAITQAEGRNDMLLGGTVFFNEFVSKATAKEIHAFIIDMDNVYSGVLQRALLDDWKTASGDDIPLPTYIVNSGTGLHLYFVLKKPLPCYKTQMTMIDQLYRRLAVLETTNRVYLRKSVQWFGQDFRMAGGNGKNGWENTIFRIGDKWDADELGKAVGLKNARFLYEKPKQINFTKKPKFNLARRKGYYLNSRVYETSVERCKNETHEGNRYMSMCALSVLAYKCNIPKERLEKDLLSLIPFYNKNAERIIKPQEVYSAMKMYNEKAIDTPKVRSEDWLGWKFKGARRNGRKQKEHLERARLVQTLDYPNGEWRNKDGRPKGKSKQKDIVMQWKLNNPKGNPKDCIAETGLSKNTVYRWWKDVDIGGSIMNLKDKEEQHIDIVCRGCSIGNRANVWRGFKQSIASQSDRDINNSYLIFEEEPSNKHDPNAIKVVCRGEYFGTVGYVGREFTGKVKEILKQTKNKGYRIEMVDENEVGQREINLQVFWN